MSPNEVDRELMVSLCILKSGYSEQYFVNLTDEDLENEYKKYLSKEND